MAVRKARSVSAALPVSRMRCARSLWKLDASCMNQRNKIKKGDTPESLWLRRRLQRESMPKASIVVS